MDNQRPKHLALHLIRLPLPGLVSILHRFSGVLLFLALPLLLTLLQYSLRSIESHTRLLQVLQSPFSKLALTGLAWAFLHHFCAGIRYLLIDIDRGVELSQARSSSRWVLLASMGLTTLFGVWLW